MPKPKYNNLRRIYYTQILNNNCVCILSGLKIGNKKDLSLEHYVPCVRGEYHFTRSEENVYPAFKIINSIKSGLLPCEWEEQKYERLLYALEHYNINKHEKNIIRKAIANIPYYKINPCEYCINNIKCKTK